MPFKDKDKQREYDRERMRRTREKKKTEGHKDLATEFQKIADETTKGTSIQRVSFEALLVSALLPEMRECRPDLSDEELKELLSVIIPKIMHGIPKGGFKL